MNSQMRAFSQLEIGRYSESKISVPEMREISLSGGQLQEAGTQTFPSETLPFFLRHTYLSTHE